MDRDSEDDGYGSYRQEVVMTCEDCEFMRTLCLYSGGVLFVCDNGEEELHEVDPSQSACEIGRGGDDQLRTAQR